MKLTNAAILGLVLGLTALGCSKANNDKLLKQVASNKPGTTQSLGQKSSVKSDKIAAFADQKAMDLYFGRIFADMQKRDAQVEAQAESSASNASQADKSSAPTASNASASSSATAAGDAAPIANETITNNQISGVDEGDIVKNVGDSLVILRRGNLYAALVSGANPSQTDSIAIAAKASLKSNVWYDELIVKGDIVMVIGYRYSLGNYGSSSNGCGFAFTGAVEINSFRLTAGKFARLETRYFEASDYFDSSDYSSRLVDGKLVMYMPYPAIDSCYSNRSYSIHVPQELKLQDNGGFAAVKPLFTATSVYTNVEDLSFSPVFHTIMSCSLTDAGLLDCGAHALIGDYIETRFTSAKAVYLASSSRVYSLNLNDLKISAHAIKGHISDRFSFRETATDLQVLTLPGYDYSDAWDGTEAETSDASWSSATSSVVPAPSVTNPAEKRALTLYQLPLAAFDDQGAQAIDSLSTVVLDDFHEYSVSPRFVGKHLLFPSSADKKLYAWDTEAKSLRSMALEGNVNRIDLFADDLAFVSSSRYSTRGYQLVLTSVKLGEADLVAQEISAGNTSEADSRSHAFSQKTLADGTHLFALPTLTSTSGFTAGKSSLDFFRVDSSATIAALGSIRSGQDSTLCTSSCYDWYGNTRPIFLGNRIFALIGQEIVEVTVAANATSEAGTRLRFSKAR